MVCLNHPDVNAIAKCEACGKPLCAECVMILDNRKYCSEACHLKGLASQLRAESVIGEKRKTERKGKTGKIFVFIIIIAVACAAAYFYSKNKKAVDERASAGFESVKIRAEQAVKEGKKNVPTNSKYKHNRESMVNEQ